MAATTRTDAQELDAADPLAEFRDLFLVDDDLVAYLDGNSLGRAPRSTLKRLQSLYAEQWGGRLIRGWTEGWVDLPEQVGDRLGSAVLGAAPGQVVVADSTSVNLYKALHAATGLRPGRREVIVDDTNFPTDRYLVQSVAAQLGLTVRWIRPDPVQGPATEDLTAALGSDTAWVLLSHVDYRSSAVADLPGLTALAHEAGALAVWDLSHSAGCLDVRLDAAGADLAVACTYKYLNAGPGAPAFLYLAERHLEQVRQPLEGWFGAADVFAMAEEYEPAPSIRRMLTGTPYVPGLVAVDEGVGLVEQAGIGRIAAKARALTSFAVELIEDYGLELASPRQAPARGGHVTVRVPDAEAVTTRLIERGVVPDFRNPDLVRLGMSPLTTSYTEVWDGMAVLAEEMRD
jgi:kynureninase